MSTRSGGHRRGGWRVGELWLDPDEVRWFGERPRPGAALAGAPLLAAGDGGTLALPGFGAILRPPAAAVRVPRSPRPSRRRRLATRLLPTAASLLAASVGLPLMLASARAELLGQVGVPGLAAVGGPSLRLPQAGPAASGTPAVTAPAVAATAAQAGEPTYPAIEWRSSRAVGVPSDGRLVDGVQLPLEGPDWVTWDPALHGTPNRTARLYGTDALVRLVLDVVREYRLANPEAPRVVVGDLSRRRGGEIDQHASHENGLDVDIYFPRADGRLRPPRTVAQIDRRLAQDLVDGFVAAGAQVIFVGPSTGLSGPAGVVVPYPQHDNHLHIRIPAPASSR